MGSKDLGHWFIGIYLNVICLDSLYYLAFVFYRNKSIKTNAGTNMYNKKTVCYIMGPS